MDEKHDMYLKDNREFKDPCNTCSFRFTTIVFCKNCIHLTKEERRANINTLTEALQLYEESTKKGERVLAALEYMADEANWKATGLLRPCGVRHHGVIRVEHDITPRAFAQLHLEGIPEVTIEEVDEFKSNETQDLMRKAAEHGKKLHIHKGGRKRKFIDGLFRHDNNDEGGLKKDEETNRQTTT